jgi:hypothetical protein
MATYSINIAARIVTRHKWEVPGPYTHFCRVDAGDNRAHADEVYAKLKRCFAAPKYQLSMTEWQTVGRQIDCSTEATAVNTGER